MITDVFSASLAAMTFQESALTWGVLGVIALVSVGLLALLFAALVSIVASPRYAAGGKALWILAVFAFPVLGPLAWFIAGRSTGLERHPAPAPVR